MLPTLPICVFLLIYTYNLISFLHKVQNIKTEHSNPTTIQNRRSFQHVMSVQPMSLLVKVNEVIVSEDRSEYSFNCPV